MIQLRLPLTVGLAALALMAPPALAGTLDWGTAPTVGSFGSVRLDGLTAKTTTASVGNWSVNDATGLLQGWHVNVAASQLATSGGATLPLRSVNYAGPTMSAGSGQLPALNPVLLTTRATPVPIDLSANGATAVGVVKALAATGSGLWNFTQGASDLTLTVPATATAGTYTSTVTFTLASGPT
jgi:hypothetical protein